jgi:hypothetical protein
MAFSLIAEVVATAEVCGTQLSEIAAELMLQELEAFPDHKVRGALSRCRRELKGRMTLSEIVSRIDDGRPGADEAWAMLPWDERVTAVLPSEAMEAQGLVSPSYYAGDKQGARFAFREAYTRLVTEARTAGRPAQWQISLGWDVDGRAPAIAEAVKLGRLAIEQVPTPVRHLLPAKAETEGQKLLSGEVEKPVPMPAEIREQMQAIGKVMPAKKSAKAERVKAS